MFINIDANSLDFFFHTHTRVEEREQKRKEELIKAMSNRENNLAKKEHVPRPDLDAEIAHLWREIARLSRENNIQAEQLRNLSKK